MGENFYTEEAIAACDGAALEDNPVHGHPRIWLNVKEKGEALCPYCARRYIFVEDRKKVKSTPK